MKAEAVVKHSVLFRLGACTEEVKHEKKERKNFYNSLSVLVPCFHLTWREEVLVCRCQI